MKLERVAGITYTRPRAFLMQETGLGVAEFAGRTAYDSFSASENSDIRKMNQLLSREEDIDTSENSIFAGYKDSINDVEDAELLDKLAWTYFHHSVLEHASLSFMIKGISRAVLQELARHRIASYTIRSTRYTMSAVLNAFIASQSAPDHKEWFVNTMIELNLIVVDTKAYSAMEWGSAFDKLYFQRMAVEEEGANWEEMTIAKKSIPLLSEKMSADDLFRALDSGPKKRNVGDDFKHIVSENWRVDGMVTMNLRALKNFFDLRDSGAAWFQMRWLAEEMKLATPKKYLKLIDKKIRDEED